MLGALLFIQFYLDKYYEMAAKYVDFSNPFFFLKHSNCVTFGMVSPMILITQALGLDAMSVLS